MPELPEVETVARGLRYLSGLRLKSFEIFDAKVWFESEDEPASLEGLRLREISRRGKYILLRFEQGFTLVQHLRMTGKMLEAGSELVPALVREGVITRSGKGLQVRCSFRFEGAEVWFFDTRRFGTLTLIQDEEKFFRTKKIAPDPIHEPQLAWDWFQENMARSKKPIKSALLDQSMAAGVGNIYADEALHAAGIHPLTPAGKVKNLTPLWKHILRLLDRSIKLGGSTVRDYVGAGGQEGSFAKKLLVYDRAGEKCRTCGSTIQRIVVGGRSTHFCPQCQKRMGKPKAMK